MLDRHRASSTRTVPTDAVPLDDWAVVHDFLAVDGGAEAVTRWMCTDVLPGSPLLYLAGDPLIARSLTLGEHRQVLDPRITGRNYRLLAPLIPLLVRSAAAVPANLLVSSYAFSAALRSDGRKVIYCHSPLRQAWSGAATYSAQGPLRERVGARLLRPYFRSIDTRAADTADAIVATSAAVRDRIRAFYHRDAEIIPPPVDDETFSYDGAEHEEYFLWAGRITEPYKQLEIVLDAFSSLPGRRLLVVGDGRDRERLEQSASSNVRFLGWRSRTELAGLMRRAAALIFPSEDDFGLVSVEAQASGTPVIAYAKGGALDTVVHGWSGVLFQHQTPTAVWEAVRQYGRVDWDRAAIARRAREVWGRDRFRMAMRGVLADAVR
jgi:glycosyltransferase involved in cell wall biosynthesis